MTPDDHNKISHLFLWIKMILLCFYYVLALLGVFMYQILMREQK